jgi:hypothetical protein
MCKYIQTLISRFNCDLLQFLVFGYGCCSVGSVEEVETSQMVLEKSKM